MRDDRNITLGEAFCETVVFIAKAVGFLLAVAAVIAIAAYSVWKEIAIFQFLTGN